MTCCTEVTVPEVRSPACKSRTSGRLATTRAAGLALAALSIMLAGRPADAQQGKGVNAEAFARTLASCRSGGSDADRLRCYDDAAGALLAALQRKDVVVVDKADVAAESRPRRLGLPVSPGAAEGEKEIAGVLRAASSNRGKAWVFALEDGSVWQQTDSASFAVDPRKGDTVLVRTAALGTFKLKVGRQPAVRVKRIA